MKYIAIFDDDFLSNFRLDDNGLTLVMQDKRGYNRAVELKPIQRYALVMPNGTSIYLTDDHIQALIKFEQNKMFDEIIKDINKNFDELPESYISKEDLRRQLGLREESKDETML